MRDALGQSFWMQIFLNPVFSLAASLIAFLFAPVCKNSLSELHQQLVPGLSPWVRAY